MSEFYQQVYAITKQIPRGRVTSYGRIAAIIGKPRGARVVGYALSAIPKETLSEIPWQRVINSRGMISFKGDTFRAQLQKKLLEDEGVVFDKFDKVDWSVYGWPD